MNPLGKILFLTLFAIIGLAPVNGAFAETILPAPIFDNESQVSSNAGHIRLNWRLPEGSESSDTAFELQEAITDNFQSAKLLYQGPDRATFISGLPDGQYFYRIRASLNGRHSAWSEPVTLTVQHHSLNFAFSLFALGLLVFLATVGVIVRGVRTTE